MMTEAQFLEFFREQAQAGFGDTEETYDPETIEIPFEDVGSDCLVRQIK